MRSLGGLVLSAMLVLCGAVQQSGGAPPEPSCDSVAPFFHAKNVTARPATHAKGRICGGHCCDSETELTLQSQGQKDLAELLRHNSRSLLGPLNRTLVLLQNHVRDLINYSESRTLHLFSQIYADQSPDDPIEDFYNSVRGHVRIDPTGELSPRSSSEDVAQHVNAFFTELFPLAYNRKAPETRGDFTAAYRNCLKEHTETIQPFASYPKAIAQQLARSLEATRLLFHALRAGVDVLTEADRVIVDEHVNDNADCHAALLSMMYCAKCRGVRQVKPCAGYCLNVLRGCTSRYVAELDLPWSSYVEGVENLVAAFRRQTGEGGEAALKGLHSQISEAVMHFLNKIVDIDTKVKMNCKFPEFVPKPEPDRSGHVATSNASRTKPTAPSRHIPHFPDQQVTTFLSILAKTKGFYGELADNLCGDDAFADQRDKKCWNGERIGEYTKTVIGTAANVQMYNPEVKPTASEQRRVDSKIAALVDKLRHVHHVAVTSVGQSYVEGMQRDGADGSGSGGGPDIEDDDDEPLRGSGSGNGQGIDDDAEQRGRKPTLTMPPYEAAAGPTGGSAPAPFSTLLTCVAVIMTFATRPLRNLLV